MSSGSRAFVMVLPLIIYLLFQHVQALPISTIDQREESNHDISDSRTIWDIIWSCLSVILLCTWVSFHPGVPKPGQRKFRTYVQHGMKLGLALIAPEGVIAIALDDFVIARRFAKEYKGYGWTLTHGFFTKMGGFILYDSNKTPRALEPEEIETYLKSGEICITAEEIQDKSKGDALAKALALLQTAWFISQLIARGVQKLPITELEAVTLSYAILNFLVYAIWWNKPLNVGHPIPVLKGIPMPQFAIDKISSCNPKKASAPRYPGEDKSVPFIAIKGAVNLDHTESLTNNSRILATSVERDAQEDENNRAQSNENITNPDPAYIGKDGKLAKFGVVMLDFFNNYEIALVTSGVIFGAIHCIAWFYHFPTPAEKLIWRTCSVFITATPPIIGIIVSILIMANIGDIWDNISKILVTMIGILYALTRLILLALAFTTLRSLPPGALATVQWTIYIPHI